MIVAKNNIIVTMKQEEPKEYAILNPISGSFDLMNEEEYDQYQQVEKGIPVDPMFTSYLFERGYLYPDMESYQTALDASFKEFQEEIDIAQIQLLLLPTYSCNLACTYCFQHGIDGRPTLITKEIVDAFFNYARTEFKDAAVKPFVTLFGGEPLIGSKAHKEIVEYILEQCALYDYEFSAVTNGYDFVDYVESLKKVKVKEIQFTLDGTQEVHDVRRITANHKGSFARVIEGMEQAIANKMPVNLRTVTDRENLENLVDLAEYLDQKGWLDLPPELFKTQIGRNYELFECYGKPEHLLSQVELWAGVAKLAKEHPVLKKFHRPDFMGIRYLVDTGDLYLASFDTCPATKTEWVFDLYGDIYGCTASCGRDEFKLGTFWPTVDKKEEAIQAWKNRNVRNIEKCKSCKYDVVCGGGCGVIAAIQNNGQVLSPDCRPIQEIYDIGIPFYEDEIRELVEGDSETDFDADAFVETKVEAKTENGPTFEMGCVLCGEDLVYLDEPTKVNCAICGMEATSSVQCKHGHYVCDQCHRGDVMEQVEQILLYSTEKDPILLAERIFELPTLKMNGPEYHSIVPGVLIAAYQNNKDYRDYGAIKEALRRGKDVKGGSCGYNGNCGACVGTGVAESILLHASPATKESRGRANLATGKALVAISEYGGPQCCKRDSITSIRTYMEMTGYFEADANHAYVCEQYMRNTKCIGLDCPYFPRS